MHLESVSRKGSLYLFIFALLYCFPLYPMLRDTSGLRPRTALSCKRPAQPLAPSSTAPTATTAAAAAPTAIAEDVSDQDSVQASSCCCTDRCVFGAFACCVLVGLPAFAAAERIVGIRNDRAHLDEYFRARHASNACEKMQMFAQWQVDPLPYEKAKAMYQNDFELTEKELTALLPEKRKQCYNSKKTPPGILQRLKRRTLYYGD